MLSTVPVLRKLAVDREIRFSTEQHGCRQRDNMILTPLETQNVSFNIKTLSFFKEAICYLSVHL